MYKRIISGILGGALLLGIIFWGGLAYTLAIGILIWFGIKEYAVLLKRQGMRPQSQVMLFFSLVLLGLIYIFASRPQWFPGNPLRHSERILTITLLVTLITIFANELLRGTPDQGLVNVAVNLFGTVYIGFMFAYMLLLRFIPGSNGLFYLLFTVLVTWCNDTSAFFIGTKFGKHKLLPRISPKKSIEGSVAGLIGGILAAVVLGKVNRKPLLLMVFLGVIVVLAGQFGDLIESIIKRNAGVKDSGAFLPGHGGVLDRFDSLLMAAPVVYYLATYVMN
ncbi:MAG TPA: phosphatidate cytidylyltransferase [Bacillota bacterium]